VVSELAIMAGDGTSTRGRLAAEEQNRSMREELQTSMDGKLKGHREQLQADLHQQNPLLEARIN